MKKEIKIIIGVSVPIIIVFLILWGVMFYNTDLNKIEQNEEIYQMGEVVDIGDNFFIDKAEQPNGYSICVNSVELVNYTEIYKQNGSEPDLEMFGDYPMPDDVYLLNITVTNKGNTDGVLFVMNYALYNGSLKLTVDYVLWGLMDENYNNEYYLKLVPDSSADITIPFIPMPDDLATDKDEVNNRIKNESFLFEICDYPVRKFVEVHL
ncbi:MAG: DUF5028 domain-containing protein [Clostridia bacterium]|nr:DUF5028 domain-containing protein [Clostridia bacterium]